MWKPKGYAEVKDAAATLGVPIPDVLALARQNDPFFCGSPAQVVRANWFAELWTRFGFGAGVHLRRVHYRLVSQADPRMHDGRPYENTIPCWSYLCDAGKYARYLGLVPAEAFEDHRNPDPQLFVTPRYEAAEPYWWRGDDYWKLPAIDVDEIIGQEFDELTIETPYAEGYDYEKVDQPYHLELWIEKSTMDDVLQPVCDQYGVNLVTSLGFQSITSVVEFLQRVQRIGKPARILYVSDFDPAGDGMPTAVARQIEYWQQVFAPNSQVSLTPLALTQSQVAQYNLPRKPTNALDLRGASFEEKYDGGAVELDALEALYPGVLADIVTEAILPYRDRTLASKLSEARREAQAELASEWRDFVSDEARDLRAIDERAREIAERYRERLTQLADELESEMEPLRTELEELREQVVQASEEFQFTLPERPEPVASVSPDDEDEWLFVSERGYFEQMDYYKTRKEGNL